MILLNPHDKAGHGIRTHVFLQISQLNILVKDFLNSGSGAIDIAPGGRGATTFELTINHDVHSTLLLDNLNSLFTEYSNEAKL